MSIHLETLKEKQIGKKYNYLLVIDIEYLPIGRNGKKKYFAKCKCDCGETAYKIKIWDLMSGLVKSCGCYQKTIAAKNIFKMHEGNKKYTPIEGMARAIFRDYNIRKHPGNITFEQFFELSQLSCYYCGNIPATVCRERRASDPELRFIYNGLDRIDSTKPHDYDNCVPCCSHCNYAKRKMTQQEFFDLIKRIYSLHCK